MTPDGTVPNGSADGRDALPAHLKRRPQLFVRGSEGIQDAPDEDIAVAAGYPGWPDKGPLVDGRRITLLTGRTTYEVGEEVRVIHVVEVPEPGRSVYVMGPKEVRGEFVDGELATRRSPTEGDPLVPASYDGAVISSPAVDYNYEITTYSFSEPGLHRVQWRLGDLRSNTLEVRVVEVGEDGAGDDHA